MPVEKASSDKKEVHLTALRADHLPQAVALSSEFSWPYREADWRFAFDLGHGVAAEVDGRLVATALWWLYGDRYATCGMIIVTQQMQGYGLGRKLMDAMLDKIGDRSIILNSTEEGYRLYEKLGFTPYGKVYQHQAVLEADPLLCTEPTGIRSMHPGDETAIRGLDFAASGMDRTVLLDALFSVGTLIVMDRGTGVQAYACAREFGRGIVIGPVIAADAADAKALILSLASRHRGEFVRVDVTDDCGLSPWLSGIGLPRVGQVVAMVRGVRPITSDSAGLFALSSQSLG